MVSFVVVMKDSCRNATYTTSHFTSIFMTKWSRVKELKESLSSPSFLSPLLLISDMYHVLIQSYLKGIYVYLISHQYSLAVQYVTSILDLLLCPIPTQALSSPQSSGESFKKGHCYYPMDDSTWDILMLYCSNMLMALGNRIEAIQWLSLQTPFQSSNHDIKASMEMVRAVAFLLDGKYEPAERILVNLARQSMTYEVAHNLVYLYIRTHNSTALRKLLVSSMGKKEEL